MKFKRLIILLTLVLFAIPVMKLEAEKLPGFKTGPYYDEQVTTFNYIPDIRIQINAPSDGLFDENKPVGLAFFALPNGNTIEQTVGKVQDAGDDWHYDIQHIGAQTRFLRQKISDYNLVTIYLETKQKSWPAWKSQHPDYDEIIKNLVEYLKSYFRDYHPIVILTGHSGGGRFIFSFMDTFSEIPDYVDRICFLDSNYCRVPMGPITAQRAADFFGACMPTRKLVDQIYQNSEIKLAPVTYVPVGNENSTVQKFVEHNGAIEGQLIAAGAVPGQLIGGTKKDVVLSNKITDPARPNHVVIYGWHQLNGSAIQPTYISDSNLPGKPASFGVITEEDSQIKIVISPDANVDQYQIYISSDGIKFSAPVTFFSNEYILKNLSVDSVVYVKLRAENTAGNSIDSEVLAALPKSTGLAKILVVNGFDRTSAVNKFDFIRQHAAAIVFNGAPLESATNDAITDGLISLQDYLVVNYILGDESTVDETFSSAEQSLVSAFLKSGGRLLVSGAEIAWDLDYKGSPGADCRSDDKANQIHSRPS